MPGNDDNEKTSQIIEYFCGIVALLGPNAQPILMFNFPHPPLIYHISQSFVYVACHSSIGLSQSFEEKETLGP